MSFLNKPILQVAGYNIYPAFFIIFIFLALLIFIAILTIRSLNGRIPKAPAKKVERRKLVVTDNKKNNKEDVILEDENVFNVISNWQKENIARILEKEIADYQAEIGTNQKDNYVEYVEQVIDFVRSSKHWSVANMVRINPHLILYLTGLLAAEIEIETSNRNVDKVVSLANAIDRINGGFEKGFNINDPLINNMTDEIQSNYTGSSEGSRMIGAIDEAITFIQGFMDDGILKPDTLFAEGELSMFSIHDIHDAYHQVVTTSNFIKDLSKTNRFILAHVLNFRLRHQIESLELHDVANTLRPRDFNTLRTLITLLDEQEYKNILLEFAEYEQG